MSNEKTFTPDQAAQIAVEYARKRVNELAKSLAELRDRELQKAIVKPHEVEGRGKYMNAATASPGAEGVASGKTNTPGKLDALKAEDSPHGKEETSGEESPEDMAKEELCKECGKAEGCGCTPDMEKAMLKDSKGKEKDNGVHPDSTLPEDKKSEEVSADGSGGDIKKGKKLGKSEDLSKAAVAKPPMAKPPSGGGGLTPKAPPTSGTMKADADMNKAAPIGRSGIAVAHQKRGGAGAGAHSDKRPAAGPSASDWEDEKSVPGAFGGKKQQSKPEESGDLDKAVLNPQAKQHMLVDASRQAKPAPAAPVRPSPTPAQHEQRAAGFADFMPAAQTTGHQMSNRPRPGIFGRLSVVKKAEGDLAKADDKTGGLPEQAKIKPVTPGQADLASQYRNVAGQRAEMGRIKSVEGPAAIRQVQANVARNAAEGQAKPAIPASAKPAPPVATGALTQGSPRRGGLPPTVAQDASPTVSANVVNLPRKRPMPVPSSDEAIAPTQISKPKV